MTPDSRTAPESGAPVGKIWSISLDCDDPAPLARFWATVTGGKIVYDTDDFVAVQLPTGMWLSAVRVSGFRRSSWPDPDTPQQMHLDVSVADLDVAERAALAAGAAKADHQPAPDKWRVLFDPAGHPFCVSNQIPE